MKLKSIKEISLVVKSTVFIANRTILTFINFYPKNLKNKPVQVSLQMNKLDSHNDKVPPLPNNSSKTSTKRWRPKLPNWKPRPKITCKNLNKPKARLHKCTNKNA